MKRILLGTDFSDNCRNAQTYLISLIEGQDVVVDLVHIFDIPVSTAVVMVPNAILDMINIRKEKTTEKLDSLMDIFPKKQQGNCHSIYSGYPAVEIIELSQEKASNLIVLALRSDHNLLDRMLGSTTAQVIQHGHIPVLAIPSGCSFKPIREVLFPTIMDADKPMERHEKSTLDALIGLKEFFHFQEIQLLHVAKEMHTSITEQALKQSEYEVKFHEAVASSVDKGILTYLENDNIDLIAIYKRHRNFWERLYHSSITRKILHQSKIPLLVFS